MDFFLVFFLVVFLDDFFAAFLPVTYEPIAGHRASTALVKYLSEGREMEMALAPVAGTRLLVPIRVLVVSMLANLVIEADRFEATAEPLDASTLADPKPQ